MTQREAFKAIFLFQCAQDGLNGQQVKDRIEKLAAALEKRAGLSDLAEKGINMGTVAALTLPVMAGAGVGYLAHRAAVPEVDENDVKKRELIDELRHFARRARDQQRVKSLRLAMP